MNERAARGALPRAGALLGTVIYALVSLNLAYPESFRTGRGRPAPQAGMDMVRSIADSQAIPMPMAAEEIPRAAHIG
ncbi:MAG TPA: hypothetical protein VJ385_23090 [Fibrobacteria bacterium]|nr:hypothetical protein [Fibrobacteria bacterium]